MFDYPLLSGRDSTYARLGVSPDATAAEIRDAKAGMTGGMARRKQELERRLTEVYGKVPELKAARGELQRAAGETDERKRQALVKRCRHLEAEALRLAPDFVAREREVKQIDAQVSELNNIRLETSEERYKYDTATPPCALLKLAAYELPVVTHPRVMLHNVRRAMATFLEEEKGVACFHPSDLTRRLFLADYEPNPLLDEEKT